MRDQTTKEIIGIVAIIIGILIIVYPLLVGYLAGIFLVIYGVLELIMMPRVNKHPGIIITFFSINIYLNLWNYITISGRDSLSYLVLLQAPVSLPWFPLKLFG